MKETPLNHATRRILRLLAMGMIVAGLGACHFHGHHGHACVPHLHVPCCR